MTKRILVFDDDLRKQQEWRTRLGQLPEVDGAFAVDPITLAQFRDEVALLQDRRRAARSRRAPTESSDNKSLFDDTAILVVDYDLLKAYDDVSVTGESVSYLARCYSDCGLIVGLNQYGDRVFDLRLEEHPESFADVNVGGSQVANPGLWGREPWSGFRPWHWPALPRALEDLEHRATNIADQLDEPIVSALGLPETVVNALPRPAAEFISGGRTRIQDTTFREFVEGSGNGLEGRDKAAGDNATARIAAAKVGTWVRAFLLRGQDILIDAPHLAERFPSLLTGEASARKSWAKTTSFKARSRLGVRHSRITEFEFRRSEWTGRAAWYWGSLSSFEEIKEVRSPWSTTAIPLVFCEDVSQFLPPDEAQEFLANVVSPYSRRHIADRRRVKNKSLARALKQVRYQHEARLAL